ncbi:DUF4200 domain-containing protein [Halomonas borealis]|uniref:DUF4200 domain-containing protein n=1 Tax=Halomonas borealis TaxID=2508710 RepID=UPI0010A0B0D4|nr:DUF4200 domain-containing protein [Halomonas borealis]
MTAWLRLVPGWAWVGLLAIVLTWLGWLQLERVTAQRDAALAELNSTRGEIAALESGLEWRRENARRLMAALEQREQALTAARETIRGHREALDRLEDDDAEVRDWLSDPVPGGVADWVRQLRGPHDADPGDTSGAGDADGSAASSRGEGESASQPARSAG